MESVKQTRDEAKKELLATINGREQKVDFLKRVPEWFTGFYHEMEKISQRIGEIKPIYKEMALQSTKDRAYQNISGSTTNHLMCDLENQALMIMPDTLIDDNKDNNVEVTAHVFDGLLIYKEDVKDLLKLFRECEIEILKKWDVN